MAVTIGSDGSDGKHYEITLDKTGATTGTVRVQTWNDKTDHPGNPADKDDVTKLNGVKAKSDGSKIVCVAEVFGPDPQVTFAVKGPQPPQKPSVTVTITGSLGGLGDGTTTYPITDADFTSIKNFISSSGFPPTS